MTPERAHELGRRLSAECDHVVIVDNTRSTESQEQIGAITVISGAGNLGFGRAVMLGVADCHEDIVLVLNDDVVPSVGFIAAMLRPFARAEVHAVCAHLKSWGTPHSESLGLAVDRTLRSLDVTSPAEVADVLGPSGAAAAYRRSTLLTLGGFAPELFAYWEDVDLALRMWAAGYEVAVAADALADHARGSTLGWRSPRQRELDAFGRGFILSRYRTWLRLSDRLLVPLLDWPSLLRGVWKLRSLSVIDARLAGHRAGRKQVAEPVPRDFPKRPVLATLTAQVRAGQRSARSRIP